MQHESRWHGSHKHTSVKVFKQKWFLGQAITYSTSSKQSIQKPASQDRLQGKKLSYLNDWLGYKSYKSSAFFAEGRELSKGNNPTETLGRSGNTKDRPW